MLVGRQRFVSQRSFQAEQHLVRTSFLKPRCQERNMAMEAARRVDLHRFPDLSGAAM